MGTVGTVRLNSHFKTAEIDLQVIPCQINTKKKLAILCQELVGSLLLRCKIGFGISGGIFAQNS